MVVEVDMPTFTPPTYTKPFNPETQGGEAKEWSLWRYYSDARKVGFHVIISGDALRGDYPGLAHPPANFITGTNEAGSTFVRTPADQADVEGEGGYRWWRGGIAYEISAAEAAILTAGGYGAHIT